MDLLELQLLEEKIKGLLNVLTRLKLDNQQLKQKLEGEGKTVETNSGSMQKQRIKSRINEMLEQLEAFQLD